MLNFLHNLKNGKYVIFSIPNNSTVNNQKYFCPLDAKAYVQAEQQVNHLSFECANLKQYGDIYMKKKCSSDWSQDRPKIKTACENPGKALDQDPFGSTPVTSMDSGFTYKNYFCAVCNYDSVDVRFWRPRLECPTLTSYSNRFHNLTKDFVKDNLIANEAGRWGINIDTSGVKVFHECTIGNFCSLLTVE